MDSSSSTSALAGRTDALPAAVDVLVIGAGPGGVYAGIALEKAGIGSFLIVEKADAVGGTWWHNRYPGCECDVRSHLYSYSFAPNPEWTRPYAGQQEILEYVQGVAERFGVTRHCRFGVEVRAARWQDGRGRWQVETTTGARIEARAIISAIGMFNDLHIPDLPGLGDFAGLQFHTARWPRDLDLAGRRVALIGSAASAVQTAPEIAPVVAQLDLYQRTPQWVLPKNDAPYTPAERARFRSDPAAVAAERETIYRELESAILFDNPNMLAAAHQAGLANLEAVADPDLRRRLTPSMRYGCRRPLLSNRYYPMFNRSNVALVDTGIARITADGITDGDGRHRAVDTIILATGFETTRYLAAIDVRGRGGVSIHAAWADGAQAFQGMSTHGFPNLFMLYGPNTNNGSLIRMIELEVDYAVARIGRAFARGQALDVRRDAMDRYNAELQRDIAAITVWADDCRGYYRAPSGRIVTQCPYTMGMWQARLAADDGDSYEWLGAADAATA